MIFISFNVSGLGNSSKTISLGSLGELHNPNILMLLEIMGEEGKS
jgi:hypothetical protein